MTRCAYFWPTPPKYVLVPGMIPGMIPGKRTPVKRTYTAGLYYSSTIQVQTLTNEQLE